MSDIVDKANDLVDAFTSQSIEAQKNAAQSKYPYKEGEADFHCHECGVLIPVLRRKVTSSEYCIECKEYLDDLSSRGC